jgi:hypothetical protein
MKPSVLDNPRSRAVLKLLVEARRAGWSELSIREISARLCLTRAETLPILAELGLLDCVVTIQRPSGPHLAITTFGRETLSSSIGRRARRRDARIQRAIDTAWGAIMWICRD